MKRLLLGVLLLSGCEDVVQHGALVELSVTRTACNGSDTASDATHWRLRVLRDGRLFKEQTGPMSQVVPAWVTAPEDGSMAVRLELFDDAGNVVAWGQSRALGPGALAGASLAVALARTEQFHDTCLRLSTPRAAHSATVLADGRVFIAAGHGGGVAPRALASFELLDVGARSVTDGGTLTLNVAGAAYTLPTADHRALATAPSQVLLWGGWRDGPGLRVAQAFIVVWDTDVQQLGAYPSTLPPSPPRYGHALVARGSEVFALGGTTRTDAEVPASLVERLDVSSGMRAQVGALDPALAGAAIAPLEPGAGVAGGRFQDGGVSDQLVLLSLGDAAAAAWSGALAQARANATAAPLGDGVLVAGGVDALGRPLGTTEWLHATAPPARTPGPSIAPRELPCAARLWDGRVLLVGGAAGGQASAAAEVIGPDGVARAVPFPGAARQSHACTTLADGSVLVVGGLASNGEALGDAWRYVPAPPPLAP